MHTGLQSLNSRSPLLLSRFEFLRTLCRSLLSGQKLCRRFLLAFGFSLLTLGILTLFNLLPLFDSRHLECISALWACISITGFAE